MPFPLIPVLIGAGVGAMAGGMSGDDGWDWNKALMGGVFGAATGGIGAGALGGAAALGGVGAAGAASGATSAGSVLAASGGSALGGSTLGLTSAATPAAAGLASTTAMPAGLSGLTYGMGPQALASSGAQTGSLAGVTNTPLMHSYANPNVGNQFTKAGSQFMTNKTANPNIGNQFTKAGSEFMTDKTTGSGFDYGKLGDTLQSFGGDSEQQAPSSFPDPAALSSGTGSGGNSIETELERERQAIQGGIPSSGATGLSGVERAAKGGIATKFGMMKTPSGALTGGEIVGPGTGTSDTIRSAIYPDLASKLGASSMQAPQGGGHQVQKAALSDGEFVLTAKAVEGLGKNANAPPGKEREYGSKLLDQAMNQWQRI